MPATGHGAGCVVFGCRGGGGGFSDGAIGTLGARTEPGRIDCISIIA